MQATTTHFQTPNSTWRPSGQRNSARLLQPKLAMELGVSARLGNVPTKQVVGPPQLRSARRSAVLQRRNPGQRLELELKCCAFVHGRELWATATLALNGLSSGSLLLVRWVRLQQRLCASRAQSSIWPWARQCKPSGVRAASASELHLNWRGSCNCNWKLVAAPGAGFLARYATRTYCQWQRQIKICAQLWPTHLVRKPAR
uniref:HDC15895 n=1 Tax=Drosophila melanogaster TaxID=7227 RepID=Q6IJ50_DROME|nr:TPA_inf: HDC15895 [Drosophila melanogaster]